MSAAIVDWRDRQGFFGRPVSAGNLHVTLLFLGQQPMERVTQIVQLARQLKPAAFQVQLDRIDCWHEGLLHLLPSQPIPGLVQLVANLRQQMQPLGLQPDLRRYQPHLTLARHCQTCTLPAVPTFSWTARQFSLLSSEPGFAGVHYRPLAHCKLS